MRTSPSSAIIEAGANYRPCWFRMGLLALCHLGPPQWVGKYHQSTSQITPIEWRWWCSHRYLHPLSHPCLKPSSRQCPHTYATPSALCLPHRRCSPYMPLWSCCAHRLGFCVLLSLTPIHKLPSSVSLIWVWKENYPPITLSKKTSWYCGFSCTYISSWIWCCFLITCSF